jgi:hypothetical protein
MPINSIPTVSKSRLMARLYTARTWLDRRPRAGRLDSIK